jgi:hypothetical protein
MPTTELEELDLIVEVSMAEKNALSDAMQASYSVQFSIEDCERILAQIVEDKYADYQKAAGECKARDQKNPPQQLECVVAMASWYAVYWALDVVRQSIENATATSPLSKRIKEILDESCTAYNSYKAAFETLFRTDPPPPSLSIPLSPIDWVGAALNEQIAKNAQRVEFNRRVQQYSKVTSYEAAVIIARRETGYNGPA